MSFPAPPPTIQPPSPNVVSSPWRGVGLGVVRIGPGFQLGLGAFQASLDEAKKMGFDTMVYGGYMVELWFQYGLSMVKVWFKYGSCGKTTWLYGRYMV